MSDAQTDSKYARKRRSGKMMYGPGCCGHSLPDHTTPAQKELIDAAHEYRRRATSVGKIAAKIVASNRR